MCIISEFGRQLKSLYSDSPSTENLQWIILVVWKKKRKRKKSKNTKLSVQKKQTNLHADPVCKQGHTGDRVYSVSEI